MNVKPYAKSLLAGAIAAISFAVPVVDDGLVPSEILGIVLAGLIGLGVVYRVPNKDDDAEHQDESVQPPEHPGLFDGHDGE